MKFMILMSEDPSWDDLSEEEQSQIIQDHEKFETDLKTQGCYIDSARFKPESGAAIEQLPTGEKNSVPAPVSGQGAIGGYYLIEAETLDQAMSWASRCRFITGTNWIYPLWT